MKVITYIPLLFVLVFCRYSASQSAFRRCHLLYPKDSCFALHVPLKSGIVNDYRNIYELQEAFYPIGKFASDRFVNVLYTVEFSDEALRQAGNSCDGTLETDAVDLADDITNLTRVQFLAGWTSSGVFNILSPLQLTKLQLQISNDIYSLFVIPGSGIFYPERFGWVIRDMQQNTVNLYTVNLVNINITVDNVSCVPDTQLIKSVLQDLTSMLKIWASTEGLIPQEINEDDLGYVTEPGFPISGIPNIIQHQPFFAVLLTCICFLLGLSAMAVMGTTFHNVYKYLAHDRKQFRLYFFALTACSFFVNMTIIAIDLAKVPEWCSTSHFDYITNSVKVGCDGTIIAKIVYFGLAILVSLVAAGISSRRYEVMFITNQRLKRHARLIYILCSWTLILTTALVTWAIVPTVIQIMIYPSAILTITFVMIASIFWITVIFSIPMLFVNNLRRKSDCLSIYFYLAPACGMVLVGIIFGFLTITYLNAVIFGTVIGGIIGILVAIVPSILLTLFTEFYRDWFLTQTTPKSEETTSIGGTPDMELKEVMTSSIDNNNEKIIKLKKPSIIERAPSLIPTGEPPGFLQKRIKQLQPRKTEYL